MATVSVFLVDNNFNWLYLNLHAVLSRGNYLMFIGRVSGRGEGQRFWCMRRRDNSHTSLTLFCDASSACPVQLQSDFPLNAIPSHLKTRPSVLFKGQTPAHWRATEVCFSCSATWARLPWQCRLFQVYLGASRWHQCPCSSFSVQVMTVLHVEIPVPTNNLEFGP